MEGRVALPALELEEADRAAIALDIGLHVVGEPGLVEDVGRADGREIVGQIGHRTVLEPSFWKFEARLRRGPQGEQVKAVS